MITKNKTNTNLTISALDLSSPKNVDEVSKKPKKEFETIKDGENILFLIDSNSDLRRIYSHLVKISQTLQKDFNIDLNSFLSIKDGDKFNLILNVVIALTFHSEPAFTMKTSPAKVVNANLVFDEKVEDIVEEVLAIKEAHFFCRKLQDMPSSVLNPETYVKYIKELFTPLKNVKITVLNKKELVAKKMGLILGVNAGSEVEAKMIVAEYKNNSKSKDYFGYVGKGITFDSGGMNIKTGSFMRHMKFDMSGSAIMLSTVYALAKNNVKTNVVAVTPLTENLVSPAAIRPDDVLTSYSGKTVEIDNTDAEGRLILADALSYAAKDLKVTKLVDVATLTGAMRYALGATYTGVWTTTDSDWIKFEKIAHDAGEYVWRLPMHEDFKNLLLKTKIADIANSISNPNAGSSRAACFLSEFTLGVDYIHLDVAATADVDDIGQAVMVRTLYNFAKEQ